MKNLFLLISLCLLANSNPSTAQKYLSLTDQLAQVDSVKNISRQSVNGVITNNNISVTFDSLELSTNEIDVTDNAQTVTYTVKLTTSEVISVDAVYMHIKPSAQANQNQYIWQYFTNIEQSGNSIIATVDIDFPSYYAGGIWTLESLSISFNQNHYEDIWGDELEIFNDTRDLIVENRNEVDVDAPKIVDATISETHIDVTEEKVVVDFQFVVTDESGVNDMNVTLTPDQWENSVHFYISKWQPTGDPTMFIGSAQVEFDTNTKPGEWELIISSLTDSHNAGLDDYIYSKSLADSGLPSSITIANSNERDEHPPVIKSLTFEGLPDYDNSDHPVRITATIEAEDPSGIEGGTMSVIEPVTGLEHYFYFYGFSRIGDTDVWEDSYSVNFPAGYQPGVYKISFFSIEDSFHNDLYSWDEEKSAELLKTETAFYIGAPENRPADIALSAKRGSNTVLRTNTSEFILTANADKNLSKDEILSFTFSIEPAVNFKDIIVKGIENFNLQCELSVSEGMCDVTLNEEAEEISLVIAYHYFGTAAHHLSAHVESSSDDATMLNNSAKVSFTPLNRAIQHFDADGDGKADLGVRRGPLNAQIVRMSSSKKVERYDYGFDEADLPVTGDFDGDSLSEVASFNSSRGEWQVRLSSSGEVDTVTFAAAVNAIPVRGDFDGDAISDFAVYTAGMWTYRSSRSGDLISGQLGGETDIPAPADYDGDMQTDFAVRQPDSGHWLIRSSLTGEDTRHFFGNQQSDIPVPADYDGDGKADIAVRRPTGKIWVVKHSSTGKIYRTRFSARGDDIPIIGDYDGDGKADYATRRPLRAKQYALRSGDKGVSRAHFGSLYSDLPVSANPFENMRWLEHVNEAGAQAEPDEIEVSDMDRLVELPMQISEF